MCHDHSLSGANKSLLDWITVADKDEYKITCVIPRKNDEFEKICKEAKIEVIRGNYIVTLKHLYKLNPKEYVKNLIKNILKIFINPISFIYLKNKLKKMNIELIHSNSFALTLGVKLAKKLQVPHLWHIREFLEEDHKIAHFESKEKIKNLCKYSNAIFISDVIKNKFDVFFENERKKVIYNKIKYDENYVKNREFGKDNFYNIVIAGTLNINKGQMDAIKAIQELKEQNYTNIKLFICGSGNEEFKLKQYVNENNLQEYVKFEGQVTNLTEFRKNMDIALVCSKMEALGRVTVEAMYYKNLVIGANAGCTPYIIEEGETGILYTSGDYKEMAEKIKSVIKDNENSIKILKNAQQTAIERFHNIEYSSEIFNIYDKMLEDN